MNDAAAGPPFSTSVGRLNASVSAPLYILTSFFPLSYSFRVQTHYLFIYLLTFICKSSFYSESKANILLVGHDVSPTGSFVEAPYLFPVLAVSASGLE